MPNKTIKDLFETPEDVADYLVRKFVKYQKTLIKSTVINNSRK